MKIIFVTRESYEMPGGRIRCYDMAEALGRLGVSAGVFSFPDRLGAMSGRQEGSMGFWAKLVLNVRAFAALMREPGPAAIVLQRVHYHVFGPFLAAVLRRFPVILDMDDWEFREAEPAQGGVFSGSKAVVLARFLARRSRLCVAASAYLRGFVSGANAATFLIPSGIKLRRLDPYRVARAHQSGPLVFGWLGTVFRTEDVEDLRMLLRAFLEVSRAGTDVRLDIAGDGLHMAAVRDYFRSLNFPQPDRVRFLGWLSPDSVGAFIYETDVGLNPMLRPSRFNRSKCPVSLLEFMACGKPTVSSRVGEVPEIVRNGTDGLIADSEKMFSEHMRMLANEPSFRARLGLAAKERVEKEYSIDVLAARFKAVLADRGIAL